MIAYFFFTKWVLLRWLSILRGHWRGCDDIDYSWILARSKVISTNMFVVTLVSPGFTKEKMFSKHVCAQSLRRRPLGQPPKRQRWTLKKVNNLYSSVISGNFVLLSIQTMSSPRATVGTTLSWNIAEQVSLQSKVVLGQRWMINTLFPSSKCKTTYHLLSADFVLSSIDFWENGPTAAIFVWLVPSASCLLRYSL